MSSLVGALQLPVPTGAALGELTDPTLSAIMKYLAHWITSELGAKVGQQAPFSSDPCPTSNLFPWEPASTFVRAAVPALYCWHGKATGLATGSTLVYEAIEREINVLYIFDELVKPEGMRARHGIYKAIGDIFAKASSRGLHPTFGYNGDPLGTPLYLSANFLKFEFMSGTPGWLEAVPEATGATKYNIQRGFPAYNAKFTVVERVYGDTPDDGDALIDASLSINASDGLSSETTPMLDRELEGPDGGDE